MKNTVLLLLLGSIATTGAVNLQTASKTDQKNGQAEQAVASGKSQGQSLIEALASTDLDMSSFEGLLGQELQQVKTKSKTKSKS